MIHNVKMHGLHSGTSAGERLLVLTRLHVTAFKQTPHSSVLPNALSGVALGLCAYAAAKATRDLESRKELEHFRRGVARHRGNSIGQFYGEEGAFEPMTH